MGWFKYDTLTGWVDYTTHTEFNADRSQIILTLTDGGAGDADGVVNGIIEDPSGLGLKNSNSGSSGGCFIMSLF